MATIDSSIAGAETVADDLDNRYLTFFMKDVFYGIELSHVIEIVSVPPITTIPSLPNYIKGIINLRGKVVPVIDVRLKFNQEAREYDDKTCIIVVVINDMHVGLIVDSVAEVLTIEKNQCTLPPDFGTSSTDKYLKSIAKIDSQVVMNIDCQKFFHADLNSY